MKTPEAAVSTASAPERLRYFTQAASSPGTGVAACIVLRAARQAQRVAEAALQCGLSPSQLRQLFHGTLPLAALSLRTLGTIAAFLEFEPVVLAISAGYLRDGDFDTPDTRPAIAPYAGEWAAWLRSDTVATWREWTRMFGRANVEAARGLDTCVRVSVTPMPRPRPSGPPEYLRTWVLETLRQRGDDLSVASRALGLRPAELRCFLENRVNPQLYPRAQLRRFADFLGVPAVAVLAAIDALEGRHGCTQAVAKEPPGHPPLQRGQ